ncbi:glycoside hydrolase family 2 [Sphingomonas koreensis]|nr:glycoside hydrolase family 2 [Sphingomonas koreensis]
MMARLTGIATTLALLLSGTAASAQTADDHVYTSNLTTSWGKAVTPDNAWRLYPRPQMKRDRWQNLNGLWDYAILPKATAQPAQMDGQILVPFPVESKLSRVARKVTPDDRIWYRRSFTVPADWRGQHVMLNFAAVDYAATVLVNGAVVGSHKGGFATFGFDITDYLKPGQNELTVEVTDPTSKGNQPRGKQIADPSGIWYTAVSGIWQTVWLEPVPEAHIADVRATPDIDRGVLDVDVATDAGTDGTAAVRLTASDHGKVVAQTIIRANRHATLKIPNAHLWSPEDPYLYDLKAELVRVKSPYVGQHKTYDARFTAQEQADYAHATVVGAPSDTVDSYFAMRKISIGPGKLPGQPVMLLNNKPYFENGTLDQGWWPDGLYTPPSEEAMQSDIVFLKKAGFNMLRKHIKVEPARYYYDADHLGMLIWQDLPSGGSDSEDQFITGTSKSQAVFSSDDMDEIQNELAHMIGDLNDFPSIVLWVINNEGWGQYNSAMLARYAKGMDPSRLIDSDTGWLDVAPDASDVFDIHTYEDVPHAPAFHSKRAIVLGEYGGVGYPISGHLWREDQTWSYQVAKTPADYLSRLRTKMEEVLRQAKEDGLSASVYTQTTDVEGEINGLLTYDRAQSKAPPEDIAKIAAPLWQDDAGE